MTFAHPWFFLLLIPLALALLAAWRKREPGIRIPSIRPYEMASKHGLRVMNWRKMTLFALWAAGGILCVVALARPQEGLEEIKQRADGIDIIIALDLSGSMEAIDIPSSVSSQAQLNSQLRDGTLKNRLETAKAEIRKFIEARPNDRIGLIVFAQLPYVACPPTLDHAWLIANLERLNPGDIGDATGIAGPLASAVQRLKDSDAKSRVVVLFTDGRNNVSAKVTPRQAAKLADTFNVTVYTVGIEQRHRPPDRAFRLLIRPRTRGIRRGTSARHRLHFRRPILQSRRRGRHGTGHVRNRQAGKNQRRTAHCHQLA